MMIMSFKGTGKARFLRWSRSRRLRTRLQHPALWGKSFKIWQMFG